MWCEDCIHYKVCAKLTDAYIDDNFSVIGNKYVEDECSNFYPKTQWISVNEAFPSFSSSWKKWGDLEYIDSERVLVCIFQKSGKIMIKEGFLRKFSNGDFVWKVPGTINTITHWTHMPEPPIF